MNNKVILADSCFWLGLLDNRDQNHQKAKYLEKYLNNYQVLFPWPCLYETISTRLIRNRERVFMIEKFIKRPNIILLNDIDYRVSALATVFDNNRYENLHYSLTDCIIRGIIKNLTLNIRYLITFNKKDFVGLNRQRFTVIPSD